MTENNRTTINVSKDAHRKAKEAKEENESWSDYIKRCIGEREEPMQEVDMSEVIERLERIETAQGGTVEEALSMNADVDESEIARMIVADLKAELPTKIAEELQP